MIENFMASHLFLYIDCFDHMSSWVSFNNHKFHHIVLLILSPDSIKLIQCFNKERLALFQGLQSHGLLISDFETRERDSELVKCTHHSSAAVQNFIWEDIFLPVYPKMRECFLSWIKNLWQECATLFIENSICLWELLPVVPTLLFKSIGLHEILDIFEEGRATRLALLWFKV